MTKLACRRLWYTDCRHGLAVGCCSWLTPWSGRWIAAVGRRTTGRRLRKTRHHRLISRRRASRDGWRRRLLPVCCTYHINHLHRQIKLFSLLLFRHSVLVPQIISGLDQDPARSKNPGSSASLPICWIVGNLAPNLGTIERFYAHEDFLQTNSDRNTVFSSVAVLGGCWLPRKVILRYTYSTHTAEPGFEPWSFREVL